MNFYDTYISKALPDAGNGSNLQDSLELQNIEDPVKEACIISGISEEEERQKQISKFTSMMRENVTKTKQNKTKTKKPTLDKENSKNPKLIKKSQVTKKAAMKRGKFVEKPIVFQMNKETGKRNLHLKKIGICPYPNSEVTLKSIFVIGFRITVVHSDQQKVESS